MIKDKHTDIERHRDRHR